MKLENLDIDDRLKKIVEIKDTIHVQINEAEEAIKTKNKDIYEIKSKLLKEGNLNPEKLDNIDEKIEIIEKDIEKTKNSIKDWKNIENKLSLFNKEERIRFFNEFNKFFNTIIKKIFKKNSKIKFNFNGVFAIEEGLDFENDFSGAEIRLYEIALRLTLFKFFKMLNFNFPLIIENCEKHLDDVYKENLAKTLIWFNKETNIPILITSYDDKFYRELLPLVKDKKYILNLNDYTHHNLLPEQILIQKPLDDFLNKTIKKQNI